MISVLSAVDRGFEPWLGQTKHYKARSIKEKEQRLVGSESE